MLQRSILCLLAALTSLSLLGCEIAVNEQYGNTRLYGASDELCQMYCFDLYDCGALKASELSACRDLCEESYRRDPDDTEDGCFCSLSASCDAEEVSDCKDAPLHDFLVYEDGASFDFELDGWMSWSVGDDGVEIAGDSSTGGGDGGDRASGGSGGEEPLACGSDHECSIGEDCIAGRCLSRCTASCECAEGEVCVSGYCGTVPEPIETCETDCDCESGKACVEGACVDP